MRTLGDRCVSTNGNARVGRELLQFIRRRQQPEPEPEPESEPEHSSWMSGFLLGFALCGSLVTCGAYGLYEMQREKETREAREEKKRRKRKSGRRKKLRREKIPGRLRSPSRSPSSPKRIDASGLARGTSSAARRTAQLVTDEVRLALGNDYEDWSDAFQHMDRDNNGDLTASEFRRGLQSLTGKKLSAAQLDDLMYEIDRNGDGRVDYLEFIAAFRRTEHARQLAQSVTSELRRSIDVQRESLLRAFDRMDTNKDGLLTAREFQRGLSDRGIRVSEREMQQLMRVIDEDGDETLDYKEFMHALEAKYFSAGSGESEYETWSSTDGGLVGFSERRRKSGRSWQHSPSARHRHDRSVSRSRTSSGSPRPGWVGRAPHVSI
eukprot:COSAG02_NODE_1377_length_12993_cov_5.210718_2_plen_379_part_00